MTRTKHLSRYAPIVRERIRSIGRGGFAYVPNRFLHEGFFAVLSSDELRLYVLLVLASDRNGVSYYTYDALCAILRWPVERYLSARNSLIKKDLVAFNGCVFQVLELPADVPIPEPLQTEEDFELHDEATIHCLVRDEFLPR